MKDYIMSRALEWKPRLVRTKTTQIEFAKMCGVQNMAVHKWMLGKEDIIMGLPLRRFIQIEEKLEELENV